MATAAKQKASATHKGLRKLLLLWQERPTFLYIPLALGLFSLLITVVAWQITRAAVKSEIQQRFESRAENIHKAILVRLKAYEQVLLGISGFFAASQSVNRLEFRAYASSLGLSRNFPGIQGIGFATVLQPGEKSAWERRIWAEGFPEFRIWPQGGGESQSAIVFLEPFAGRNLRAFGYDMYAEPIRRAAMDLACDEGSTAMSGRVTLVQETDTDVQSGFLMYVPIYRPGFPVLTTEDRRKNLFGWAYAPFRMGDFMAGILGDEYGEVARSLELKIYDADGSLMYDSGRLSAQNQMTLQSTRPLTFGGREWTMTLVGNEDFGQTVPGGRRDSFVLVVGLVSTLVVVLVVWLFLARKDQHEKERLRNEMERNEKLRALGVLAGGIAHDFNNLLGGIYGHMEAARQLTQELRAREILDQAVRSMDRARKLTSQLLTFSRAGQPETATHSVPEFLERAVRFSLMGSGIKPDFDFPEPAPVAVFDPAQMEQVVDNLVINARQACSDSGRLYVRARTLELRADQVPGLPPGSYVLFSIQDTGPGIQPEVRAQLFDPFFSTRGEGRGLGLATAFSIVQRHGGAMAVESTPGEGAIFLVYLPAGSQGSVLSMAPPVTVKPPPEQMRVLIMDDEPSMRFSLSELLLMQGLQVDTAADGSQALQKYQEAIRANQPYSVLLADLTVPGEMGGLALAQAISEQDQSTPIVLMSGYAPDLASAPGRHNIRATLTKPFTLDQLMAALDSCFPEG